MKKSSCAVFVGLGCLVGSIALAGCGGEPPREDAPPALVPVSPLDAGTEAGAPGADVDASRSDDAGVPKRPLVIDGADDDADRYPQVVIVEVGAARCSGTLISGNRVLTAAHCACASHTSSLPPGVASRRDAAHCDANATVRFVRYLTHQDIRRAGTVTPHPDFFINQTGAGTIINSHADVAIISLPQAPPDGFAPSPLAVAVPDVGQAVSVAGFGLAACMGSFGQRRWGSNVLDAVEGEFLRISNVDGTSGAITHSGDSGGGLFAHDASGTEVLAGVTSFGRCGVAAGYTSVLAFADFLGLGCPPCTAPPATCLNATTRREFSGGTCVSATRACEYETRDTACAHGCSAGECISCQPSCNGRRCGNDGCGNPCGACATGETCVAGACQYVCPTDSGCTAEGRSCTPSGEVRTCTRDPRHPACFGHVTERCRAGEQCLPGLGCSCAPGYVSCRGACAERRAETCNGVDDDCDGLVDEDRVCVTRYDLPSIASVFPLAHTRGDREFNSHGPDVTVTVSWTRTPSNVTVRACVTMTETVGDWTTGSRCVDVVTLNVRNSAVLTPGFRVTYRDTDHGIDDAIARATSITRSDLVRAVACVGDGGGDDICDNRSFESADCSGCRLTLGTIEIVRTP